MKLRSLLTFASLLFLLVGVGIVGFSISEIKAMNAGSASQLLAEPAFRATSIARLSTPLHRSPMRGEYLGTISIPVLKKILPIYQGTQSSQLEKGVGHFEGSVMPGVVDNSVLSGHRDSVFSQFGKLKMGDLLRVDTASGKFTYKISRFRIVEANDKTVIVPTKTAVLTLSTCYPFSYLGNAPQRFIVSADLIAREKSPLSANG